VTVAGAVIVAIGLVTMLAAARWPVALPAGPHN
jgi:hypothetical protein